MERPRFFLTTDNDSHWYIIPSACETEWATWREIPGEDPRSWQPPKWAVEVGGSPTLVSFTEYEIG